MSGYDEFRNRMRTYRNKKYIGITTAELVDYDPPKLKVRYPGVDTPYSKFISAVNMGGLTEEDLGRVYIVSFDIDNYSLFVLGEAKYYGY